MYSVGVGEGEGSELCVGEGEGIELCVGEGEDLGDVDELGNGDTDGIGFFTRIPLFQTNFFPDLVHV